MAGRPRRFRAISTGLYLRIAERVSWRELLVRPFRPVFARSLVAVAAAACTVILAALLLDRSAEPPPAPAPESAQVEAVQFEQVEHALDDLDMLSQFDRSVRMDSASPRI